MDELNNHVWYEASVMNLVKIKMDYRINAIDSENTKLTEHLTIKSILPIHWYLSRLIKKSHTALFDKLSKS